MYTIYSLRLTSKFILLMTILGFSDLSAQQSTEFYKSQWKGNRTSPKVTDFKRGWKWIDRKWATTLAPGVYKTYASLFVDLDKKEEVIFREEDEFGLYRELLKRSIKPGHLLAEITGYPLASLSAAMEERKNNEYHKFDIGENFNLLNNFSLGQQEPWSVSLFLGQLATFWDLDENDDLIVAATGVSGLVLTGGLYQLFDNSFVKSNWYRVEWKVKGGGSSGANKHSWDLKTGYRNYGLSDISNTVTLALKRKKTERSRLDWRIFHNSMTSIEFELPTTETKEGFSRIYAAYGKYFPFLRRLVGIELGVLFENRREYDSVKEKFGTEKEGLWEIFVKPVVVF